MFHSSYSQKKVLLRTDAQRRGASLLELATAIFVFAAASLVAIGSVNSALVSKTSAVMRSQLVSELQEHTAELAAQPYSALLAGSWSAPGTPCTSTPSCSALTPLGTAHEATWTVVPAGDNSSVELTGTVTVADRSGPVGITSTRTVVDPAFGEWYVTSSDTTTSAN